MKISRLLFESLLFLNDNEHKVAIYLLDLGLENIAFNKEESRVIFIDLENVIVVDKLATKKENSYIMKFDDCDGQNTDCLFYNVGLMCASSYVDINFYSGSNMI